MNLLKGFLSNKSFIIFICISGASISFFFALSILLEDKDNRISTALTLFFAAAGYWAKTKYELENKSKSIIELENLMESNKTECVNLLNKSLEKLEIETKAANIVQDKEFETIKSRLAEVAVGLKNHLNSAGHIETEKRLSDLTATTKVLQLQILQVSNEKEEKRILNVLVSEQEELKKEQEDLKSFINSLGFKDRHNTINSLGFKDRHNTTKQS